jgi:uncharacterized protein (DUF4415 family)
MRQGESRHRIYASRSGNQDHLVETGHATRATSLPEGMMRKTYDFSTARRGPVRPPPAGKTRITIRLDGDVLAWFKAQVHAAGGGNYQSLINSALREHIGRASEPLEATLRRVLREELGTVRGRR